MDTLNPHAWEREVEEDPRGLRTARRLGGSLSAYVIELGRAASRGRALGRQQGARLRQRGLAVDHRASGWRYCGSASIRGDSDAHIVKGLIAISCLRSIGKRRRVSSGLDASDLLGDLHRAASPPHRRCGSALRHRRREGARQSRAALTADPVVQDRASVRCSSSFPNGARSSSAPPLPVA